MRAIVHIGTEKTGTTSIQEYLHRNRELLLSLGFYFLKTPGNKNHWQLSYYCLDESKYNLISRKGNVKPLITKDAFNFNFLKNFYAELEAVPENVHTVIISSEYFHSKVNTKSEIDTLQNLLSEVFSEVCIVCYLREQVAVCTSLYSTAIRAGKDSSIYDFFEICKPESIYFNYYEMLKNWERVFGLRSLNVRLFSKKYFLNQDLLDDFTATLSPNLIGQLDRDIILENESLTRVGQILGRAVNRKFPRYLKGIGLNSVQDKCLRLISEKYQGKGQIIPDTTQRKIKDRFIECNENLRKKFFPTLDYLFEDANYAKQVIEIDDEVFIDTLNSLFDILLESNDKY